MKRITIIAFLILAFSFSLAAKKIATYSIPLTRVEKLNLESDPNSIKIVSDDDEGPLRTQYEDSLIQVIWRCDGKRFWFNLLNKTDLPLTIDWDKIVYVGIDDEAGNVIHTGIRYMSRNEGQLKTVVIRKSKISDFLVPSKNCVLNWTWQENYLFPCVYKKKKDLEANAPNLIGKTMRIEMPLLIGEDEIIYTFYFELKDLLNGK